MSLRNGPMQNIFISSLKKLKKFMSFDILRRLIYSRRLMFYVLVTWFRFLLFVLCLFYCFVCFAFYFVCSVFLCCFVYCLSLSIMLFLPIYVLMYGSLPPSGNPTAVNKYIISKILKLNIRYMLSKMMKEANTAHG